MINSFLNSKNKKEVIVNNSNIAILCSGGSLDKLELLNDKIEYVILINYFWVDGSNNSNVPLWKTIYKFLKNKKIILLTRFINGINKEMLNKLNIIKIFWSRWSTSLLKKYEWINKSNKIKKKLRLTNQLEYSIYDRVIHILPDFLFKYCEEDLLNWNKGYLEFVKSNRSDINLKNWWNSTFGHAIDIATKLLNSKNLFIFGWDNYEGGSLNNQKIGITTDIIYCGHECKKQWVDGNKACFINKVLNNPNVNFNLYTYSKFEIVPQHFDKNLTYEINNISNLNINTFIKS